MVAHIICCNDTIKAVVLNDRERAMLELEKLAHADYERLRRFNSAYAQSTKGYRKLFYWHVRPVDIIA